MLSELENLVASAAAATPAPGAAAASGAAIPSLMDFVLAGGVLMVPIGLCSILVIAIVVERLVTLRRSTVIPKSFVAELRGSLEKGDLAAATSLCESSTSPIAAIAGAGLRRVGRRSEEVEKAVVEAGLWEVRRLRKNLRGLQVIGAIAPLLGLLGTIFGMIQAFQTVATSADALGKTELLAKGIYEAMITTAAGLIVAIPSVIGFHWITSKIDTLVAEMDRICVDLVDRVGQRSGKGATRDAATHANGSGAVPAPSTLIEARGQAAAV